MRALIQRVQSAQVNVDGALVGECGAGVLVLICAMQGDTDDMPAKLAAKISKLRIFKDNEGRMNRSVADIGGEALVVSQFTLAADTSRGNRPGFSAAAAPQDGERLYEAFAAEMGALIPTQTGQFGADMAVSLVNDGPVTIWMDTDA
ncbi:D-tyrosyl-tRNA(Tyr) deacylase [Octadecabacter temperatus]|uniref:D-aminoacyl-tRNA deacylase n=1 Tax=Octadecabacter temperatus TaxID=1458307 RepID=A0A0K0Y3I3_9RHOB|nr:D-aminoacyl-tRNA deacylase [Octadecabacter temperatus]AKS45437.1 D-tyrosyl-tRNA(Tyr) deacylase [Octadecabacter temperatus]SIN92894.1 D-tyrosyl-tRNA(Tyr) deacylase [Octadecabacter temperatus]